jgi:hypothetical protein
MQKNSGTQISNSKFWVVFWKILFFSLFLLYFFFLSSRCARTNTLYTKAQVRIHIIDSKKRSIKFLFGYFYN